MRTEHRPTMTCRILVLCYGLVVLANGCGGPAAGPSGKVVAPDNPTETHEVELKKLLDASKVPRKAPPVAQRRP